MFYKLFQEIIKNFIPMCSNPLSHKVHPISCRSIYEVIKEEIYENI